MEHAAFTPYNIQTRQTSGTPFHVQINPESYSVSSGNQHEMKREGVSAKQKPIYFTFLEREPSVLSMEMVFNSYTPDIPETKLPNIRDAYRTLRDFLAVTSESHAPPVVLFAWGKVSFVGVLTHLEENFTMFASTGTPVRARVKVSLKGCFQEDLQSRALHSPDRTKIRMVQQKDTLWAISAREYGDPAQWRQIALANGIRNPRKLQQVSQLVIPPLPKEGSSDGPI